MIHRSLLLFVISLYTTSTFAIDVTFQVDLSIQEAISRFDPSDDVVELRGTFNGWSGGTQMEPDANSPSVYRLPVDLGENPGAVVQYKFVILKSGGTVIWEGNVGDGQSNRAYAQEESDHALPLAYFDNLAIDPGAGVDVTFQVDMAARIQDQLFDPTNDFVSVRGPFNNWEGVEPMIPIEEGSSVYESTVAVKFILSGSDVPYKFIVNGAEWEDGENRLFKLAEQMQTVPARYFNDVEPAILLPLGALRISPITDGRFTLSWDNADAILQGSADFSQGWDDISDAAGKTQVTLGTDLAKALFFRLATP